MKRRNNKFNPKRALAELTPENLQLCASLAKKVKYGGNPEHKRNPGDFGLSPPSDPRPGKSLCDGVAVFTRAEAVRYLRAGLKRGLISDRFISGWPKNIWSVTESGVALEAQIENVLLGVYHGYPMPDSDPFVEDVLKRWNSKQ
ncbi:hypothetical protein [Massilia sp. CFBP9026]|uniref:hypothetical protein n=1 Tax=Massilia sp. CFBP9026 TaxID=3096536 RepID=UPI002A6B56F4|nr:hypothetical protein [Massilia sp. CFBP9026]MDY0962950.1 hypothetical protein [Massilia sp. CFBP9026]